MVPASLFPQTEESALLLDVLPHNFSQQEEDDFSQEAHRTQDRCGRRRKVRRLPFRTLLRLSRNEHTLHLTVTTHNEPTEATGLAGPKNSMNSKQEVRPDWGHPIVTPDGREIRVPHWAMQELRKANFLVGNTAELKAVIYGALGKLQNNLISEDLSRVLGPDLSGPATVECYCGSCQKAHSDVDDTPLPRGAVSRAIADRAIREARQKKAELKRASLLKKIAA